MFKVSVLGVVKQITMGELSLISLDRMKTKNIAHRLSKSPRVKLKTFPSSLHCIVKSCWALASAFHHSSRCSHPSS